MPGCSNEEDFHPLYLQTADESKGASVIRLTNPAGRGPTPHVHTRMEESFYVLEGEYTFFLGDDTVQGGPGRFVFVRPGTLHSFRNVGDTTGRLLCICTPPGFEKYFQELEALGWPLKTTDPDDRRGCVPSTTPSNLSGASVAVRAARERGRPAGMTLPHQCPSPI
jgi:mannose-6-phosphate isomerase-like protein (cupin superfamily)